jgi:integrase/recombinase XerD
LSGLWQDWSRTVGPEENPWRGIPRRRPEVRVAHKILSRDEVAALLAGALDRPRLYALLATLYYLGLRISEAIQLEWEDLFREGGGGRVWATVYGKRGRTRQVPVPDHVLAAWRQGNSKQEGVILLGPFGRPWSRHAAHHAIQRYALASGFPAISPHWLRHSSAAHLLEQGIAINKVQAWLGHANLATTSIYVRLGVSAEMADVL